MDMNNKIIFSKCQIDEGMVVSGKKFKGMEIFYNSDGYGYSLLHPNEVPKIEKQLQKGKCFDHKDLLHLCDSRYLLLLKIVKANAIGYSSEALDRSLYLPALIKIMEIQFFDHSNIEIAFLIYRHLRENLDLDKNTISEIAGAMIINTTFDLTHFNDFEEGYEKMGKEELAVYLDKKLPNKINVKATKI